MAHIERNVPAVRSAARPISHSGTRASLLQGLLFVAAFGFTVAVVFGAVN